MTGGPIRVAAGHAWWQREVWPGRRYPTLHVHVPAEPASTVRVRLAAVIRAWRARGKPYEP